MTNTVLQLPYTRFIKRAQTHGSNTQFLGLMKESFLALQVSPWVLTYEQRSSLPFNDPLTFVASDEFDAYKQSWIKKAASGMQTSHLGASIYRFKTPDDAAAVPVNSITFTATSDKFAYSGIRLAIILSNSATPPNDWELITNGGVESTVDTTGEFSIVGDNGFGALNSHDKEKVKDALNQSKEFTFNLSGVGTVYRYIFIAVTMFDYTDYRESRQYWVEGSGCLIGSSVRFEFNTTSPIEPDPTPKNYALSYTNLLSSSNPDFLSNWTQVVVAKGNMKMEGTINPDEQYVRWLYGVGAFPYAVDKVSLPTNIAGGYTPGAYLTIGHDDEVLSVATVRIFKETSPSTPSKVRLDVPVPAPPVGVTLGYALYRVLLRAPNNTQDLLSLDLLRDVVFWSGRATVIGTGIASGVVTHESGGLNEITPATDAHWFLADHTPSYASGVRFPSKESYVLALYIHSITQSPGNAKGIKYGSLLNTAKLELI